MPTTTPPSGLRVRGLAEQSINSALEADWTRATELNRRILEALPEDVDAHNRLGRALIEQGKLEDARDAFEKVLKVEPNNLIALRNRSRVSSLIEHKGKVFMTKTRTQPRLFIEDMGKTGILRLINPAPAHVLAKYSPGAEAELREQEGLLAVHARDGELLGFLEPKVGRRLLDLLATGNQYVVAIVSSEHTNPRIAIREVFQSAENAHRISFPGHHRPIETKERAYIKGTFFRFAEDEDGLDDADRTDDDADDASPVSDEAAEEGVLSEEPLAEDDDDSDDDEGDES